MNRLLLPIVCLLPLAGFAAEPDDVARLRRAGIGATADGIRQYLESLQKSDSQPAAKQLVEELGDARFRARERATRRLAQMAFPPIEQLERATQDRDTERSMRAKQILASLRASESSSILLPAMRIVEENRFDVGMPLLIRIADRAQSPPLREAILKAMQAIVKDKDRAAVTQLLRRDELELRNLGRRLLARLSSGSGAPLLEGVFEAVQLTPGNVHSGGSNLVHGWEFVARSELLVTELAIYDTGRNGLKDPHEVAIWDLEDRKAPVAQATIPAGSKAKLVGFLRYQPIAPVPLKANRRYAVVAHYPSTHDSTASLVNPSGLSVKYADHLQVIGRRYSFPHKAMAFPTHLGEGALHATLGPGFRFEANPLPKDR